MNNIQVYLRMFLYVGVTTIITFCSLVDTIKADQIANVNTFEWIKIILKSLIPGLVSLKAFLDTSASAQNTEKIASQDK